MSDQADATRDAFATMDAFAQLSRAFDHVLVCLSAQRHLPLGREQRALVLGLQIDAIAAEVARWERKEPT